VISFQNAAAPSDDTASSGRPLPRRTHKTISLVPVVKNNYLKNNTPALSLVRRVRSAAVLHLLRCFIRHEGHASSSRHSGANVRFSVNELMERYIFHRNWQWHHDKTVWPASVGEGTEQ
jgi:hypothetical protein